MNSFCRGNHGYFRGVSVARPHPQRTHRGVDGIFHKNELEREEWRARINRDRSSHEDREIEWARKGAENDTEQFREVERVQKEMKQYRAVL